ncbi:MAG: hypothetical protein QF755_06410 [Candidatus Peribacteraceae bacterium]|nr:hypothetical protein [Candidatus Peribacteraceae bacterium]
MKTSASSGLIASWLGLTGAVDDCCWTAPVLPLSGLSAVPQPGAKHRQTTVHRVTATKEIGTRFIAFPLSKKK